MPTANTYTYTPAKLEPIYKPELALPSVAKFKANVDIALGTLVGEYLADPGVYGAYNHAAGDGLQVLKGITIYHVVTDADGKITNAGGPIPTSELSSPIWKGGYFACGDVANASELDDAIAAGFCTLIEGTATTGVFKLL